MICLLDILVDPLAYLAEALEVIAEPPIRKSNRVRLLINYIKGYLDFFDTNEVKKILESEPVKKYARQLDLEEFLEYLKRHPELIQKL